MTEVAVVIPTHNREALLASTLRSILAQHNADLTVVVVDDGSSFPRSVEMVVEACADPRTRLIRHDSPRGVSAARNTGISSSVSEWVAFCDDDDVWAPQKLSAQLHAARSGSAPWAYTGDISVDDSLHVLDGFPPLSPRELVAELAHYNPVPAGASNVIVRREVLGIVGQFDSTLRSVGDWDLWIRLARYGVPACVPRPLVGCRVHRRAITSNRQLMLKEVSIVARRHGVTVDWARHLRWAAWNSMLERQRLEALRYYARAIAVGDFASAGRAVLALLHPRVFRQKVAGADDPWARDAETWLRDLRDY